MVLPDRIELSTSPLPMECSTTELRQHAPDTRIGSKGTPAERPILATSLPHAQAREATDRPAKTGEISAESPLAPFDGQVEADLVPICFRRAGDALIGGMTLIRPSGRLHDPIDPPALPFAGTGTKFRRALALA